MAFTIDAGSGSPARRSQLTLNRRTAEVVRWEAFADYNAGRRVRLWLRFLHTGEAGGIAGQTIAAVTTMGAVLLVYTGLVLAGRRYVAWRRRRQSAGLAEAAQGLVEETETATPITRRA